MERSPWAIIRKKKVCSRHEHVPASASSVARCTCLQRLPPHHKVARLAQRLEALDKLHEPAVDDAAVHEGAVHEPAVPAPIVTRPVCMCAQKMQVLCLLLGKTCLACCTQLRPA